MRCRVALGVLLLVVLTSGAALAQTGQASVVWQRFDVDLTVRTDGSLAVAESQTISIRGSVQQGSRVIPLDHTSGISDVSVAEAVNGREQAYVSGSNSPGTFTTKRVTGGQEIDWWFAPGSDTARTFIVRYVAHDALRQYSSGDQVQWKAVFADRSGAVQAGDVSVHLPIDTGADAPTALYLFTSQGGPEREVGSATRLDPRTLRFALPPLPSGTGAEIRAQFPHGAITAQPPAWQADADRADWVQQNLAPVATFIALLLTLAIAVGGGVGVFMVWYSRGREPSVGSAPLVLDTPPSSLPAPLAGTLVDGSADLQDAVATLVDLAGRGVLTLAEEPGAPPDVRVTLRGPIDDPTLRLYERVLLTALFDRTAAIGEDILLSAARARFAAAVPVLEERLHAAVADEGLFVDNPEQVRRRYRAIGLAAVLGGVAIAVLAGAFLGWISGAVVLPGLALAVVGGVLMWIAPAMPRRTPGGALEATRWQAFRAHLADESRDAPVDPQHLAYAVAFGIDRTFLRRLEDTATQAPDWYGPGPMLNRPGGWYGGPWIGGPRRHDDAPSSGGSGPTMSAPTVPSPQGWSDALSGLLTAASDALAHGGGSGRWSGGGWGGGGGGGGGSGGFH